MKQEEMPQTLFHRMHKRIQLQQELIDLLYGQVVDLSMMSKIELGDDVIAEIKRLKGLLDGN